MFSSVLHKRLPAETGISVVCVSPGIVQTNVVNIQIIFALCPLCVKRFQYALHKQKYIALNSL